MATEMKQRNTEPPPPPPPPPDGQPRRSYLRPLVGTIRVRGWHLIAGAVVALALVGGAAGTGNGERDREIARLEGDLATAREGIAETEGDMEAAVSGFEADLAQAEASLVEAEEAAKTADERARKEARADLADERKKLEQRAKTLDAQDRDLRKREKKVGIRERFIDRNSFGDGRYKVGSDIKAGSYKAPGNAGCYWAKLGSSDGINILSNHFGPGPQTLVIDSPWFETSGCGTWVPA